MALVLRYAYGFGLLEPAGTDEEELARFRAFLQGAGAPSRPAR